MTFTEQAKAPYPIGSRVMVEGRKGIWIVYDHHGHSWPLGQDINQVVLHKANNIQELVYTTWIDFVGRDEVHLSY
jgi:hypothetical protein